MRKTDGGEPSWWERKREREERERKKEEPVDEVASYKSRPMCRDS